MRKTAIGIFVFMLGISLLSFNCTVNEKSTKKSVIQNHKWEKLGQRTVDIKADHDEIIVTAHEGAFTKLKFKILKAPIHVRNINIVFRNGDKKNIQLNRKFSPGSESKVVDLPGNKRIIKKIILNYKTVPGVNSKAIVVVLGRH